MSWLLDTCALSEYAKKFPAPEVIAWLDEQDEASLFISVITLGEIEKGILELRITDPRRSQKLTAWLGLNNASRAVFCHSMPPRSTFGRKLQFTLNWQGKLYQ